MAGKNSKSRPIAGYNVYQDRKGQNIMYLRSTGCGYIVKDSDQQNFTLYHNRYALAVAVFMLLAYLFSSWKMPLAVAAVFAVILEIRFRKKWLPSLTRIEKYQPPEDKRSMVKALVEMNNRPRSLLLGILYLAFGILFVIDIFTISSGIVIKIGSFVVLAGCLYMSSVYFRAVAQMH